MATGVMNIHTRKYRHLGVHILRNFTGPVVIIGTPFSTQTDTVSFENMSGAEWPSIKWPIQVVEIIHPDRWKVRARN